MSPLYSVVFSSRCTSTHHRLAMDALRHLRGDKAEKWADLFLVQYDAYLKGAKAPDDDFKDFKNHVLHVKDNYWGGADKAAEEWYARTVAALGAKKWKDAAYAAGVMSHYIVDPLQPFHTGQTETENVIHRAVEQSFSKSWGDFQAIIERDGGHKDVALPIGANWLSQTVRAGAEAANPHYNTIIDHYNFARGAKKPLEGMDDVLREAIAPLIARAAVTFARVLERAISEAAVKPPFVVPALDAFFASTTAPIQKILNSMADGNERAYVLKMFKEFEKTGKVAKTLPEDDRVVRAQYAAEVLKVPVAQLDAEKPRTIGAAHGAVIKAKPAAEPRVQKPARERPAPEEPEMSAPIEEAPAEAKPKKARAPRAKAEPKEPKPKAEKAPAAPRARKKKAEPVYDPHSPFAVLAPGGVLDRTASEDDLPPLHEPAPAPAPPPGVRLHRDDHIVDAPAIGPKAAARFEAIGFKTVADLLEASPEDIAKSLRQSHMTPPIIRDWQAQALLACTLPNVRSIDAQALVASDIRDAETLAKQDARKLLAAVDAFLQTPNGKNIARNAKAPTLDIVKAWIDAAKKTPKQASAAA